jgi:hypothetical protein
MASNVTVTKSFAIDAISALDLPVGEKVQNASRLVRKWGVMELWRTVATDEAGAKMTTGLGAR